MSERVDRCVDGFLARVSPANVEDTSTGELRSYVEDTYCALFERRGWVHEDGGLSIAAHRWLEDGAMCRAGETTQEVPCAELESRDRHLVLDCAILHRVRRSEVQRYVRDLQRERTVECDDDTPLAELGTP